MSDTLRITGMASGLDVDAMVESMMSAQNIKLDTANQKEQMLEWKQETYRDVIGDINTFKSTYFDVLSKDNYMLSSSNYSNFDVSYSESNYVTVTGSTTAEAGTYTLSNITKAQTAKQTGSIMNVVQADDAITLPLTIDADNNTLSVYVNGVKNDITLTNGEYSSLEDLNTEINAQLLSAGISDEVEVDASLDGTTIQIKGKTSDSIKLKGDILTDLGFDNTSFDIDQSVSDLVSNSITGTVEFTINDVSFSYDFSGDDSDMTYQDIIDDIEEDADVDVNYSQLGRTFSIASKTTGTSSTLTGSDTTGNFLDTIFGNSSMNLIGSDANVTITDPLGNSSTVVKSKNNFSIDGVTYNLTKETTDSIEVTLTQNIDDTLDSVVGFIDKYNTMIEKINDLIDETRDYDYDPLTDDQKEEMTDDEIESWETMAKQGIVKNDSILSNMLTKMRTAFYESVSGAGITLSEIGLSTSADTSEKGKIIIDEDTLKTALTNNGEGIVKLFTQSSTSYSSYDPDLTSTERATRNSEEGIFQRLNDILQDNVRTIRDDNGYKGLLLQKAGIQGDYSEFNNLLADQLKAQQEFIDDLTDTLADKEEAYYLQFTSLETTMQSLNNQSSWLSQMMGTSSS